MVVVIFVDWGMRKKHESHSEVVLTVCVRVCLCVCVLVLFINLFFFILRKIIEE